MQITINTKYAGEETVTIRQAQYGDGSIALQLLDETGQPVVVPTVNLEAYNEHPMPGHVFIKNWSENEGVLESLIEAGVISNPVREVPSGFATAYECKILI